MRAAYATAGPNKFHRARLRGILESSRIDAPAGAGRSHSELELSEASMTAQSPRS